MMTDNPVRESKSNSNKVILPIFIVLGICGFILFAVMHKTVFPSAAINLSVPKSDILKIAEIWTSKLGYQKEKVIKSITFNCDDDVKTFLEFELGNAKANELMQKQVPVFYWDCSFKREFDQEQIRITISPSGELSYFDHTFPNDQALPDIDHAQAKAKAFDFILQQTGWPKEDCKLVEDNVDKQLHRKDHEFIWENQKADYKGAKLRASTSFSGNVLSGYYKFLKLPESWNRKYETIRSYNNLLQTIATVFYVLLHIAAVFIFFQSIASRQIRWRFVLICAGVLTVICLLENFNNIESVLSAYDPRKSYSAFLAISIFSMLVSLPFSFMGITVILGAAERVYRLAFADHLPWQKWFTTSALSSKYVSGGIILGYAAFAISLGYQICYYALGQKFNFWCPLGIDNYQILTAVQPWFSAFTLGVFASGSEELMYRVIMLGFGQKLLKNFWVANVLQAMAWGFMHSSYPQQPAYARGVELTIEGIFWGWILKRYGLIPCLVAHYLFDVFCDSLPLFSAHGIYLKLSPFVPLLPFLVLAIVGICLHRKRGAAIEDSFLPPQASNANANAALAASSSSSSKQDLPDKTEYVYQPLLNSTRWALAGVIGLCLILTIIWKEPHYQICQENAPLKTNAEEVLKISRDYLIKNHFDLTGYTGAANCGSTLPYHKDEFQYIFEKAGFAKADTIAREIEYPHLWQARYFKPGQADEYVVCLNKDGKVISQTITRDEDTAGARLTQTEARKIALDYLHSYRPLYEPLIFSDVEVKNRAHRTDYYFQFKSPKYKIADADLIATMAILGDIPSYQGHHWKIPDEWKWEKAKITLPKAVVIIVLALVSLACFIALIWWVISLFLARIIRWRTAILPGLVFVAFITIMGLNCFPSTFFSYHTTIPVPIYVFMLVVGGMLGILFAGAAMIFCLALATAAIAQLGLTKQVSYALKSLAPWLNRNNTKSQFNFWLDAVLIGGAYKLFSDIYALATLTATAGYSHIALLNSSSILDSAVNTFSPTISEITTLITMLYAMISITLIVIGVLNKFGIRKPWQIFLFILIATVLASVSAIFISTDFHWQEIVLSAFFGIIGSLLFWFFLRKAALHNVLGLFLWLYLSQLTSSLKEFIECGWTIIPVDICVLVAVALLPIAYVIYLKVRSNSNSSVQVLEI